MTGHSSPKEPFSLVQVPFPVTAPFRMQPGLQRIDDPLARALQPTSEQAFAESQKAVALARRLGRLPLLAGALPSSGDQLGPREFDDLASALSLMKQALAPVTARTSRDLPDGSPVSNHVVQTAQTVRMQMQDDFVVDDWVDHQRLSARLARQSHGRGYAHWLAAGRQARARVLATTSTSGRCCVDSPCCTVSLCDDARAWRIASSRLDVVWRGATVSSSGRRDS